MSFRHRTRQAPGLVASAANWHAVGLHTATGERDGRRLSVHAVLVFHLRDGTVVEAWEHYDDSRAVDEFLGS